MHHEQLCNFLCDTPVGAVLEEVESDNYEEFYRLYLHDFVMGTYRCKHKSSDLTTMEMKVSTSIKLNIVLIVYNQSLSACF